MFKIADLKFENIIHFFYKVNNGRYIMTSTEGDSNITSLFEMDVINSMDFMREVLKLPEKDIETILGK